MKNLITLFLVVMSLISCEEKKLPSNISSMLSMEQHYLNELNSVDSLIMLLNEQDIKKLSNDSCLSLIANHELYQDWYDKSHDELNEVLKINPIYSDYPEIKNKKYHFTIENKMSYDNGIGLIMDNIQKLKEKRLSSYY